MSTRELDSVSLSFRRIYRVLVLIGHVFACAQLNSQSSQNKHTIYNQDVREYLAEEYGLRDCDWPKLFVQYIRGPGHPVQLRPDAHVDPRQPRLPSALLPRLLLLLPRSAAAPAVPGTILKERGTSLSEKEVKHRHLKWNFSSCRTWQARRPPRQSHLPTL